MVKDETMARTVHWLESISLLFNVDLEHVVRVVIPMSGDLPQLRVVQVGSHDLLEAALPVLLLDVVHELVVDVRALGLEEAGAGAELVEEEQVLLLKEIQEILS